MAKKEKRNISFLKLLSEIGIITIGILIAYQLNNWKELRSLRNAEGKMLQEIKSNLELDLIDLKGNRDAHKIAESLIDSLQSIAKANVYRNEIPLFIRHSLRDFIFNAQTSAFETLKAKGVHLISNDSIRIRILRLYDFDYSTIVKLEESYQPNQFTNYYRHIVLNYFDGFNLKKLNEIKPIYPGADWLLKPDIKNKLDLVRAEHQFALRMYENCIIKLNSLVKDIDTELKNEF